MNRPWQIWTAFIACLVVAVAAVGWLSIKALGVEQQAALEENARLALWRMDSLMAPLVAQESARPYFTYSSFYSADRAYGRMFNRKAGDADVTVPSPLLSQTSPFIRLHFQFDGANAITSPEVPLGKFAEMAVPQYLTEQQSDTNGKLLGSLRKSLDFTNLLSQLPEPLEATSTPEVVTSNGVASSWVNGNSLLNTSNQRFNLYSQNPATQGQQREIADANNSAVAAQQDKPFTLEQQQPQQPGFSNQAVQSQRGDIEYQARQRSVEISRNVSQFAGANYDYAQGQTSDVQVSMMTPLWYAGDLLLARKVKAGNREYVQGCLLDWPAIKQQLLGDVSDLLPSAELLPATETSAGSNIRRLASLPIELIPGLASSFFSGGWSPIKISLLGAWGAMSLAALAIAVLLRGVIALSERRAAFVSAVTHELRTPLTTFRMYAEMLSEGMVRDESDRKSYLQTLRIEADRLTHLVGNVLAYARLERGKPGGRVETVTVEQLLKVGTQRLADRAGQANLQLQVAPNDGVLLRWVKTDPAAVEQVLFNLVDNACKYAVDATDRTLRLGVASQNGEVQLRVRDFGPGVPANERRKLFQPFHKSAQDAAGSAPGVGLGLALSKRLAVDMRGDLQYEAPTEGPGACFVLTLPAAD